VVWKILKFCRAARAETSLGAADTSVCATSIAMSLTLTPMPGPRGSPWTRFRLIESVSNQSRKADGASASGPGVRPTRQRLFAADQVFVFFPLANHAKTIAGDASMVTARSARVTVLGARASHGSDAVRSDGSAPQLRPGVWTTPVGERAAAAMPVSISRTATRCAPVPMTIAR